MTPYWQGRLDYVCGFSFEENPFAFDTWARIEWDYGWKDAAGD
jgi:hypothetical protein